MMDKDTIAMIVLAVFLVIFLMLNNLFGPTYLGVNDQSEYSGGYNE